MAETADALEEGEEEESGPSLSELVEQLARDTTGLVVRQLQLEATRRVPEIRQVIRGICVALIIGIALLTAFVLVNWAAVEALSTQLSGWRAPAVIAGAWLLIALALSTVVVMRALRGPRRPWWLMMRSDPAAAIQDREQAREHAEEEVRETMKQLAGAAAAEAETRIASAIVPLAAGGVAEVGEGLLDMSEDVVEVIEDEVPGGGAIAQIVDFALLPGRLGLRMVTMATRRRSDSD